MTNQSMNNALVDITRKTSAEINRSLFIVNQLFNLSPERVLGLIAT